MKNKERKLFSLFDVIIILIVIVASAFALVSQFNNEHDNLVCVVRVDGNITNTISLDEITDTKEITVDSLLPVTVVVTSDSVYVESASCPDKLCEHTGEITRSGQSIVCLPAKVSVSLVCDNNSVDAVVG